MVADQQEVEDTLPGLDIATAFYQKYQPKEILGRGVSSTVRRAVHKESGQSFAVKIIDVSADVVDQDGLNLREQTMREINILRLVAGHENIIQLLDVFESVTYIFLVFELCEEGELFDYLNRVVTISEKKARRIMRQVVEALQHCHARQVVHRDIKPENILLDTDHNVKLTDFGFAKILRSEERLYEVGSRCAAGLTVLDRFAAPPATWRPSCSGPAWSSRPTATDTARQTDSIVCKARTDMSPLLSVLDELLNVLNTALVSLT